MNKFQKILKNEMIPFVEEMIAKEQEMITKLEKKKSLFFNDDGIYKMICECEEWKANYKKRLTDYKNYINNK